MHLKPSTILYPLYSETSAWLFLRRRFPRPFDLSRRIFTCFGATLLSCFLPFSAPLFSVKDLLPIPKSPPPPSYSTSCSLESTFPSFTSSFATCKYKSSTHPLLNLEIILLNSSLAKASTKFFRCTDFRNFTILAGNFISSPWSTFISK